MHDDYQRTALQQAGHAIHCLTEISFFLVNDTIKQVHEGFQYIRFKNSLPQKLVFC